MTRVVFDTNILVSALLQPLGPPARVFELALSDVIRMCVTGSIFAEYEAVIRRPRFARSEDVIAATLETVRTRGFWVRPSEAVCACTDPDDNIFLECAQAANADYLVTGNVKHFPPSWGRTRVLTARALVDIVSGGENALPAR